MKPIVAKALKPGDTIALVAPAGPLDRPRIEKAIAALQQKDLKIKTYRDIYETHGYLAGSDHVRADELNQAFADSEIAAIFPARGGTGVTRILDQLEFNRLSVNPKIITGFSDITALHLAVFSRTGLVTFHSPNPMDGLGHADNLTELTERTYWRAFMAEDYSREGIAPWQVPLSSTDRDQLVTRRPGVARGRILGGNLALICSLMGTPFEINAKGAILLLEDIGEQPYRVDRFLSQLKLAGKLDVLSGAIVGQFTDCFPEGNKPTLTIDEIIETYFSVLNIPVLQNFPTGHTRDNVTLPLGVLAELDATEKTLKILEDPVQL